MHTNRVSTFFNCERAYTQVLDISFHYSRWDKVLHHFPSNLYTFVELKATKDSYTLMLHMCSRYLTLKCVHTNDTSSPSFKRLFYY